MEQRYQVRSIGISASTSYSKRWAREREARCKSWGWKGDLRSERVEGFGGWSQCHGSGRQGTRESLCGIRNAPVRRVPGFLLRPLKNRIMHLLLIVRSSWTISLGRLPLSLLFVVGPLCVCDSTRESWNFSLWKWIFQDWLFQVQNSISQLSSTFNHTSIKLHPLHTQESAFDIKLHSASKNKQKSSCFTQSNSKVTTNEATSLKSTLWKVIDNR